MKEDGEGGIVWDNSPPVHTGKIGDIPDAYHRYREIENCESNECIADVMFRCEAGWNVGDAWDLIETGRYYSINVSYNQFGEDVHVKFPFWYQYTDTDIGDSIGDYRWGNLDNHDGKSIVS